MKLLVSKKKIRQVVETLEKMPSHIGLFTSDYLMVSTSKKEITFRRASSLHGSFSIPATSQESSRNWSGCIDRRLFSTFILAASAKGQDLEIHTNGSFLVIRDQKRKIQLAVSSVNGNYGELTDPKGFQEVKISSDFQKRVTQAVGFASVQVSEPEKNCVFVTGNKVYSANQNSGIEIQLSQNLPNLAFPLQFASIWQFFPSERLSVSSKQLKLTIPNGYFLQSFFPLALRKFPVQRFEEIKKKFSDRAVAVKFNTSSFLKCMERCRGYFFSATDEERFLTVQTSGSKARVQIKIGGTEISERFKVVDGPSVEMELSFDYLNPFFTILDLRRELSVTIESECPIMFYQQPVRFFLARRSK